MYRYKIGNYYRHKTIISLGALMGFPPKKHIALAESIQEIITGNENILFGQDAVDRDVDRLAQMFAVKIVKNKNDIRYISIGYKVTFASWVK